MSTRITKNQASHVAKLMVDATINKKVKEIKIKISELITPVAENNVPAEIMEAFLKYPNYFRSTDHVNCIFNGGGAEYCGLTKLVPNTDSWNPYIETPKDIYTKIVKLSNEKSKLIDKARNIEKNIYETLVSLNTFKKIKEQFPDAFSYIPSEWMSESFSVLAVPIEDITSELQKYM